MKNIKILFIIFFSTCVSFAQTGERIPVSGNITIPVKEEVQGINIQNLNTGRGAITDESGNFIIPVAVNDSLQVSSVQFQEFIIIVDEGIVETGQLNITVNEVVNQLPEVIVSPYDLTGNVSVDLNRLEVVKLPDTLTSVDVQSMYFEIDAAPDFREKPRNVAMNDRAQFAEGLNFARLFRELVTTSQMERTVKRDADINEKIRELYDDKFFQEYLKLELENINDFIYFADDRGLSEAMLTEGNELDLIDFLIEQSRNYREQKAGK